MKFLSYTLLVSGYRLRNIQFLFLICIMIGNALSLIVNPFHYSMSFRNSFYISITLYWWIISKSIHSTFTVYLYMYFLCILFIVFSESIHCHVTICAQSILCLFIFYFLAIHILFSLFIFYSQSIHIIFPVYSYSINSFFTVFPIVTCKSHSLPMRIHHYC